MKIECKLQRDGGTHITLGQDEYHFSPQPDGAHVAEITNEEHIDRLLSISEAYRLYRAEKPAKAGAPPADEDNQPPAPVTDPAAPVASVAQKPAAKTTTSKKK